MKKFGLFLLMLGAAAGALAQEEMQTLITGRVEHGGFGGPSFRAGTIGDQTALFIGGRGGWILNHALVIGAGGYGLVTEVEASSTTRVEMGYGGMEFGFVLGSNRLIHLTAQALVGAGGVTEHYKDIFDHYYDDWDTYPFFVLEPGIDLVLNVAPFMRVAAGVNYRYIDGTDLPAFTDEDFSGVSGVITLKFGKF